MPFSSHFIAITPPPDWSKRGPYDALLHSVTSQPLLLFKSELQSVRFTPLSCFLQVSDYIKWHQLNHTHINSSRYEYIGVYLTTWLSNEKMRWKEKSSEVSLPGEVCHAIWLCWLSWTPSRISISPPWNRGQVRTQNSKKKKLLLSANWRLRSKKQARQL